MKNFKKEILKILNDKKIKHFKTESNLKSKNNSNYPSSKNTIIHNFNYKLFLFNEKNRKSIKNNIQHVNAKDLFRNIIVKNFNKKYYNNNNILNTNSKISNFSKNDTRTTNYLNSQYNSSKSSIKIIPKYIKRIKYNSPDVKIILTKHNNIRKKTDNNVKLGFVPLYHLYNNKENKINRKKFIENNEWFGKEKLYKYNKDNNDILSRTNYYSNNKILLKKSKNFFNIKKKREHSDSKNEENDMKPKIRFLIMKKDLREENLKINRMFAEFNKEILEKEKLLKFIGNNKIRKNMVNDSMNNF